MEPLVAQVRIGFDTGGDMQGHRGGVSQLAPRLGTGKDVAGHRTPSGGTFGHFAAASLLGVVPVALIRKQYFRLEINDLRAANRYNEGVFERGGTNVRRILVVDDDEEIGALLRRFLERNGFGVDVALSGAEMDQRLAQGGYDLMTLDLMLPGEDGLSLCRRVRAKSALPIIMVTATGATSERIVGLEVGADDYLVKPFDPRELLARARAILRRADTPGAAPASARPTIRFAGWHLDVARRELRAADDTLVPLSGGEFDLLLAFVEHPQRVLTREQLIDLARGDRHEAFDRSIDVQVSRLRRKFGYDASAPELIRTIRHAGYMFAVPVERG